jgi:serine/threonine-protein kinase RsbW
MDVHVRVELSLPRDASYVPLTRNVAACLMDDMGVPDEAAEDVKVALSEACANVVRHAEGAHGYSVSLEVTPAGCEIEVIDLGAGFATNAQGQIDTDAEDGRGILLMRALVDDFQFLRERNATKVRLVKRWPGALVSLPGG